VERQVSLVVRALLTRIKISEKDKNAIDAKARKVVKTS
jgi:hypothetical protein